MSGLVCQRIRHALRVHGAALVNGRILGRDKAALADHLESVYHTPCTSLGVGVSGVGLDVGWGEQSGAGLGCVNGGAAASLASQEEALRCMVREATTMLRADTPLYGHPGDHRDELVAVNQRLLVLVDAIAVAIETVESFCQRFEAVSELVAAVMCNKYHGRAEVGVAMTLTQLIMSCCHRSGSSSRRDEGKGEGGDFHPSNELEVQLCYHLAEAISNPTPVNRGLSLSIARDKMSELGLSSERVVAMVVRGKGSMDVVSGGGDW